MTLLQHWRVLAYIFFTLFFYGFLPAQNLVPKKADSLLLLLTIDKADSGAIINQISEYYSQRSPYKAKLYANQALEICRITRDKPCMADAFRNLGVVLWLQGYFQESLAHCRQARSLYKELQDTSKQAKTWNLTGLIHYWRDDYDSAIHYLNLSISLYRILDDHPNLAKGLNNIGQVYDKKAEYMTSYQCFFESLKLKGGVDRILEQQGTQFDIGPIRDSEYFQDKVIAETQKNYQLAREKQDTASMILTLTKIGNLYLQQKKHEHALNTFLSSLPLTRIYGDTSDLWNTYINVGVTLRKIDRHDEAIAYFSNAARLQHMQGWWLKEARSYALIGNTYRSMHTYDSAIRYYKMSVEINRKYDYRLSIVRGQHEIVKCFLALMNYNNALQFAKESLELSEQILAKDFASRSLNYIAQSYAGLNQYELAYSYYSRFKERSDSILDEKGRRDIARYQTDFESSRKDSEINLLSELSQFQKDTIVQRNWFLGILAFAFFMVFLLATQLYFKFKVVRKKEREKEVLLGEVHHRVKNNLQVISSLLKLQSRQLQDGPAKGAVLDGRGRVKAMGLVHQRLYQHEEYSFIDMRDYIEKLVESLADTYGFSKSTFNCHIQADNLQIEVEVAVTIGLILNELISNTFKHGFLKKKGDNLLRISLSKDDHNIILQMEDNGVGMDKDLLSDGNNSFGIKLVRSLAKELNGKLLFENTGNGARVTLKAKIK